MKDSNARDIVARIQAAYPRQPWPAPTVALFAEELARLPMEADAATGCIRRMIRERTSEFAPSIGEILSAIVTQVDAAPPFAEAWAEMEGRSSEGNYFAPNEPPEFSHAAITRLARLIGWQNFTQAPVGDAYFRHDAARLYAYAVTERASELLASPERMAMTPGRTPAPLRELVEGIGT